MSEYNKTLGDFIKASMDMHSKEYMKPYRDNTRALEAERARDSGSAHYKGMKIEPWDVVDEWTIEQQVGYHRGNILKYTMRMGSKDERLKEAKKILHYAQKLVEVLEKDNGTNTGKQS